MEHWTSWSIIDDRNKKCSRGDCAGERVEWAGDWNDGKGDILAPATMSSPHEALHKCLLNGWVIRMFWLNFNSYFWVA